MLMKLPKEYDALTGGAVRLHGPICGIKRAGRHWSFPLRKTQMEGAGVVQAKMAFSYQRKRKGGVEMLYSAGR